MTSDLNNLKDSVQNRKTSFRFILILKTYKIIAQFLSPFIKIFFLTRSFVSKKDSHQCVNQRFGKVPDQYLKTPTHNHRIWIHVASVGEFLSIKKLVNEILKNNEHLQILITSTTLTASNLIQAFSNDRIFHQLIPADVPTWIASFLDFWKPGKAIFVESEIWPNWLSSIKKRNIKIILLNARISDRSFSKWQSFPLVAQELFQFFDLCIAQNLETLERLNYFKAKNCYYLGNLKNFSDPLNIDSSLHKLLNNNTDTPHTITFASTHEGEEDQVFQVIKALWEKDNHYRFILAPRHPHRTKAVTHLCKSFGLNFITLTDLFSTKNTTSDLSKCVIIVDQLGYMGTFYNLSSVVFIGGSFTKVGGHNPIEAIRFGKIVCFGPHMYNFKDIVQTIKKIYQPYVNNTNQLIKFIECYTQDENLYKQDTSKLDEFFDIDINFFQDIVKLVLI